MAGEAAPAPLRGSLDGDVLDDDVLVPLAAGRLPDEPDVGYALGAAEPPAGAVGYEVAALVSELRVPESPYVLAHASGVCPWAQQRVPFDAEAAQ